MPISDYLRDLRAQLGKRLILSPAVAALIRDDKGRVLMQRRSDDGRWELPAGAIDPGEPPARAVVREVYEETGLKVVPERVVGVFGGRSRVYPNGDEVEPTAVLFACRAVGGRLEARDGEAAAFRYVAPEVMPEHYLFPRHVFALDFAGVYFEWDEEWVEALG